MSWYTDVSFWTKEPLVIQVYNDQGESFDYLPERTCKDTGEHPAGFLCSSCGESYEMWRNPNYCPNCGAKVVGA